MSPPFPLHPPSGSGSTSDSLSSSTNVSFSGHQNQALSPPSEHSSRSSSRTPHMNKSTLPPVSHTIDETIDTMNAATIGRRSRGHSISTSRIPSVLQQSTPASSSHERLHPLKHTSHVSFPVPSVPASHTSSAFTPAVSGGKGPIPHGGLIRATEMVRVVSSPLPLPSTNQSHSSPSSRPASATRSEQRPGKGRGRAFSLTRSATRSERRGVSPTWLSRLPGSLIRKKRPRSGSESSLSSTRTVNIAEVVSHRVTSADEVTSGPGGRHEEEDGEGLFAYNISHSDLPRTVDAGYGFEVPPEPKDTGDIVARGRWWTSEHRRPWSSGSVSEPQPRDGDHRHHGIERQQDREIVAEDEALRTTKEKVLRATSWVGEGAHELLAIGAEVLEFAPVPGLVTAARVLLSIWDAAQAVDLNKKVCLRLTERCANILISVREEIAGADGIGSPKFSPTLHGSPRSGHLPSPPVGSPPPPAGSESGKGMLSSPRLGGTASPKGSPREGTGLADSKTPPEGARVVGDELEAPMERLVAAFNKVLVLLQKQNRRPFLKRYLKREEIQIELAGCDAALNDALSVFGVSIQLRILKHVLRAEEERKAEIASLLERVLHTPPSANSPLPPYYSNLPPQSVLPGFNPELLNPQQGQGPSNSGGLLLQDVTSPSDVQRLNSLGVPNLVSLDSVSYEPLPEITFPEPVHYPLASIAQVVSSDPSKLSSKEVMSTITQLSELQNSHDFAHDTVALRELLRKAVATGDDFEMLKVLQVRQEEMPEAIKALQRALEEEIRKEREEKERLEKDRQATEQEQITYVTTEHITTSPADEGPLQGIAANFVEASTPQGEHAMGTEDSNAEATTETRLRRKTTGSHTTKSSKSSGSGGSRDTLDREFIESSIESLLRLSTSAGTPPAALSLPSWTITQYEIIRDAKIGQGYFGEVWRGSYRGRTVAVKVLAPWTPKELFLREVIVWDELRHPNVLELIGASAYDASGHLHPHSPRNGLPSGTLADSFHSLGGISATSGWDVPDEARSPWFFVSRCYERGNVAKWVKGLSKHEWDALLDDPAQGVLRMVHEIVGGMVYLHGRGILHGDLKCANILVNDFGHCIISDFGQSEMKSEACRISGQPLPHGTLRWQAPELMSGISDLTPQIDIYAFAITCVELLSKGNVPWFLASGDTVRHFVLDQDKRPEPPSLRAWSPELLKILHQCWDKVPEARISFSKLDEQIALLRKVHGWNGVEVVQEGEAEIEKGWERWIDCLDKDAQSPAMTIIPLSVMPPDVTSIDLPSLVPNSESSVTEHQSSSSFDGVGNRPIYRQSSLSEPTIIPASSTTVNARQPSESSGYSSRASSIMYPSSTERSDEYGDHPRPITPPPSNPRIAEIRNERRYRLTLQHEYHPSLILPLWTPVPVFLGDVGYHRKPTGSFVTLFNAFRPLDSSEAIIQKMSSMNGYVKGTGTLSQKEEKLEKRTAAQRGMDVIQGWLSRGKGEGSSPRNVGRRYSAPLRNGHKAAHLFTESTMFRFINDLGPAKRWFQANIEDILRVYGQDHPIQREDICLVICTLDAANYALFVSHHHPDSLVNFNVFASSKPGQPWGQFSVTPDPAAVGKHGGPVFHEEGPGMQSANKVSLARKASDSWDTVLLARLRFAPDKDEPTSL
ncbi:hypothetical protein BDW22DRAFT_693644 [Trametopsis cervina]|nr:hypothetical protein BDW22DRAFT_693644 [Trametopsis cervina]